jgi:probable addiction module antidote protein
VLLSPYFPPQRVAHAFGVVARASGMTQIAKDAGLSRERLYRALDENGEPEFSNVLKVAKTLGPAATSVG